MPSEAMVATPSSEEVNVTLTPYGFDRVGYVLPAPRMASKDSAFQASSGSVGVVVPLPDEPETSISSRVHPPESRASGRRRYKARFMIAKV